MTLDALEFNKKTGVENIIYQNQQKNLLDFWQWAYSDLVGNTERGILAEYIVALACGIDNRVRISWDAFDMELDNGIKIEVKSSAYIQTWKQKDFSKIIFNIPKTYAWNYKENIYETEKKRQADVYVFAVLAHKDQETLNPLDTNQWEFYVVNTNELNKQIGDAKQISIGKILKTNHLKCSFDGLLDCINFIS
ncbi:MAG: hypothetical protein ACOYOV_02925 [Bacteroidales bacterium]